MLRTGIRVIGAALAAGALLGAPASFAAGSELVRSRDVLKASSAPAKRAASPRRIVKIPTVYVSDLRISKFSFLGGSGKHVLVRVENAGNAPVGPSVLRLTVRRINGIAVGRVVEVNLPGIAANASKSVAVATKAILPVAVAIEDTTFKLDADATQAVAESDETNNRTWHNL